MGFEPCKMDPDVWLCPHGEHHYEHISVYVDDALITCNDPKSTIDILTKKHYFKLKGTCPISYHLGCDFGLDDDGTLNSVPKKCIETTIYYYYSMFGTKPKLSFSLPLENADYPELETSDHLDSDGVQKHQSMVGPIQWALSLGRLDAKTTVMTLASVRDDPRQVHLDICKIVVSYLEKFKHDDIRIRTEEPDYSSIPTTLCDWEESLYGKVKKLTPNNTPTSLGKHVLTIS